MCYNYAPVIDLLVIRDFLDAAMRDNIVAEMQLASGGPAAVYGIDEAGAVDSYVRKVTRVVVSPESRERVMRQLIEHLPQISKSILEKPQVIANELGAFPFFKVDQFYFIMVVPAIIYMGNKVTSHTK